MVLIYNNTANVEKMEKKNIPHYENKNEKIVSKQEEKGGEMCGD